MEIYRSIVSIRIKEDSVPQKQLGERVGHYPPGTKVNVYVGTVKPLLPIPDLNNPLYVEAFRLGLQIEIIAADLETKERWDYLQEIATRRNK